MFLRHTHIKKKRTLCHEQVLHGVRPDKVELEGQAADLEVIDDHAFEDPGQMLVPAFQKK